MTPSNPASEAAKPRNGSEGRAQPHPKKDALFECSDCKDIGCMCSLVSHGDEESKPKYCPFSVIEGNKTPWKFRGYGNPTTASQQRIEQVIKELERRIAKYPYTVTAVAYSDAIALLQAGDQE